MNERYNELVQDRTEYTDRCEQYAIWTLPSMLVDYNEDTKDVGIQHDYQSLGARAVTNLANKLMLALFHPKNPFFRLTISDKEKEELLEQFGTEAELDRLLARVETLATGEFNKGNFREKTIEVLKHLIISGDCLIKFNDDSMVVYNMLSYVKQISNEGVLEELIIREQRDEEDLFTIVKLEGSKYRVTQQIADGEETHVRDYAKDKLPWVSPYWQRVGLEHYGRGLVEELSGDFVQISNVSESIAKLTVIVGDVKFLVNPEGNTSVKDYNDAEVGEYLSGKPGDIVSTGIEAQPQLEALINLRNDYKRDIGGAFLLNSAVQRNAERVTATEIRANMRELEETLGGVYSTLSVNLQLPFAKRLVSMLSEEYNSLVVTILTGAEALSRFSELESWKNLFIDLSNSQNVPPDVMDRIDPDKYIAVLSAGYGLDPDKVLRTKEEYAALVENRRVQQQQALEDEAAIKGEV